MCSTSFGDDSTGPPALPCSMDDALVDSGAAASKSFLSSLEMRTTSAAGGLLPTGETSTVIKTTYNLSPLRLFSTEETNLKKTNLRTPISSISYDSSVFWKNNLPAAPSCQRVIQTVLKVVSAPARFGDRGARCFVVRLCLLERLVAICNAFWRIGSSGFKILQEKKTNR